MGPISLLLVDDHRIFLEGLRRILEARSDLRIVGVADTIEDAVDQAGAERPDRVLLDREREPCAEDTLTPREKDVLQLVGQGKRNPEIARTLAISESTVKTHISSLMRKLAIEDRLQLTLHAARARSAAR